ncbi:MAG: sorbosone dehydrogenase family protein, partial [Hyphomonadaceae bacterium]
MRAYRITILAAAAVVVSACGGPLLPEEATYGPNPQLVEPRQSFLPELGVPKAVGWPPGAQPVAPEGFSVTRFAEGLDHPRWLYVLPNGDVLVAESSTEASSGGGFMGWARNQVQDRAGALNVSADRITLLRDGDGDGVAETRHVFAQNLNQPIGMALAGGYLYVANTDALVRFAYQDGQTEVQGEGERVLDLPYHAAGNGHWTRNVVLNPLGNKLYISVGSVSNVGDEGMAVEEGRAAIHEINLDGTDHRIFATGLRNPVGMDFNPANGELWTSVNERDMLGSDLVPDYMTSVADGGFYGWPYVYWGDHPDPRFEESERPADLVARVLTPDYALGAHTASLGLAFYDGASFPARYQGGAFVGQHGSWNRREPSGYQVLFVPFANGEPSGMPE